MPSHKKTTAQPIAAPEDAPTPADTTDPTVTWSDGPYDYSHDPESDVLTILKAPDNADDTPGYTGTFTPQNPPEKDIYDAIMATKPPGEEDEEEDGDCPEDTYDQCWLLRNTSFFADHSPDGDRLGDNLHMLSGDPATVVSKLTLKDNVKFFLDAKTHELSQMMPFIRIFKQYPSGGELEMKFPNFIDPTTDLKSMLESNLQRGIGVGIESFTWKYIGENPFTAKRDLEATLVIYAQNFNELLKERAGVDSKGASKDYRFIDLIVRQPKELGPKENPRGNNPEFYRTKIAAGWASDSGGSVIDGKRGGFNDALKNMTEVLDLGLVDHAYDIKEDGSIRLTITLRPYFELAGHDPRSDVMTSPDVLAIKEEIDPILAGFSSEGGTSLSVGANTALEVDSEKIVEELKKTRADKIKQAKTESYKSLLDRLMFPKDKSKRKTNIYCVTLGPPEDVKITTEELVDGEVKEVTKTVKIYPPLDAKPIPKNATSTDFFAKNTSDDEALVPPEDILQAGTRNIPFFFLGDLFAAAFDAALELENDLKNVRIILPPFEYRDLKTNKKMIANLAEIPISVELFSSFMREKIVNTESETYPLFSFMRGVINDLVYEALGPSCGDGTVATTFDTVQIRSPAEGVDKKDPLLKMRSTGGKIDLGGIKGDLDGASKLLFPRVELNLPADETYNYVTIYPVNSPISEINPKLDTLSRYSKDYEEGRYWLSIGQSDGIVKSATFSKTQIAGYRELKFVLADQDPEALLADVYNVDINLIGNGLFIPGTRVYLNPMSLGSDKLGDPFHGSEDGKERSYASMMGLGGYHLITGVTSTITNGTFETTINCRHEGWRDATFNKADKIKDDSDKAATGAQPTTAYTMGERIA